jgi:hypothetical protein
LVLEVKTKCIIGRSIYFLSFFSKGVVQIKVLDRKKLIEFMESRKAVLDEQVVRDFSGGLWDRLSEQREVKYWKEAIERGEFDTELQEVYVILSKTEPGIVDFTFYTDKDEVINRVDELNKYAKSLEYWYITMYSNFRNGGEDVGN